METAQPPLLAAAVAADPTPARRRLAIFLKVGGIVLLIALLHVPLALTHGVLAEREGYQQQAVAEIAGVWGGAQVVTGPVLAVPYAYKNQVIRSRIVNGKKVDVEETELATATAYFLPDTLQVAGQADPEVRHRGIYDVVVYATKLHFAGAWQPDFAAAGIAADRIDWEKAYVTVGVGDLRGVRNVGLIEFPGGKAAAFEAADNEAFLPLVAKVEGVSAGGKLEFAFDAALQGSESLELTPVGKITTVELTSAWKDPSFAGAYLPVERTVGPDGFKARWETSHFSRGFPAAWSDRGEEGNLCKVRGAAFGVRFAQLADNYSLAARAQKYGVLFFVLVFAVFFLFEASAGLRIHPLQYALVGAALCLFFLGLLALSEIWPTGRAYAVAAGVCTLLVAAYAWTFLRTGWRTAVIGGGLGATYGYLYFVLQSQDYALLAGTVALFAALAAVMFFTRNLDWFGTGMVREEKP